MTTLDLSSIKLSLQVKNDQQLMDILYYSQDDYDKSVLPLIEQILVERGFSIDDIQKANESYQNLIIKLKADKNKVGTKAGFWIRVCNYIIDHSFVYYVMGYSIIYIFHDMVVSDRDSYYSLMIGAYVLYYGLTIFLFKGTLGMLIVGLRVKTQDDKKPGLPIALGRGFFMVVNLLFLSIGHLWMLDKTKLTLVDRWSGTKVVFK